MARDDADAYLLLERLRWGDGTPVCPHCSAVGSAAFLTDVAGRRVSRCASCRRQFSVLVGTILQGTRVSLWTWIGVIGDWERTGRIPTATEIRDRYRLTLPASRQLQRRLERSGAVLVGLG